MCYYIIDSNKFLIVNNSQTFISELSEFDRGIRQKFIVC